MKSSCTIILAVLLAVAASVASPCLAQQGQAVGESGRVSMTVGRGAMLISATGGSGKLVYQGMEYPFKLGGLGLGLLGVTTVEAEGEVYHLSRLEDFAGAYVQGSADWAAGSGEGVLWLTNTKGVVMRLRSKSKGVSLAIGGEGLVVQWAKGQ